MKIGFLFFLILLFLEIFLVHDILGQPTPYYQTSDNLNKGNNDSIIAGRSLFFDENLSIDSTLSCVSCHYNTVIDTLNWNPSLSDLVVKWREKSLVEFEDVFYLPLTKNLLESHSKFDLSAEQILLLKYYFNFSDKKELIIEAKKTDWNQLSFYIGIIVFVLILVDLIFFKYLKYKFVHLVLLVICVFYCSKIVYAEMIELGLQKGYEPDQPIKFSHKTHSGQNGTDCFYCHLPAKKSKSAGIPGVSICINCHAAVVEGKQSGGFEINKLIQYQQAKKPIPWVRINNLPDHVSFNHSSHVNGGVDCTECHGEIKEMNRIHQIQELSMKWCLDCHLERKINLEGNHYYSGYKEFLDKNSMPSDSASVYQLGGWDCMNCHY